MSDRLRILIAPGVYKGSLGAPAAAAAIERGLERSGLVFDAALLPVADGGTGTLDAIMAAYPNGTRQTVVVRDPLGRPVRADYGLIDNGQTAIIEAAQACGVDRLALTERNPAKASSYGVGQLLKHALDAGATQFVVMAGDLATVDAYIGCLMALGGQFFDTDGRRIIQQGGSALAKVTNADLSGLDPRWRDCQVKVATGVQRWLQTGMRPADVIDYEVSSTQYIEALAQATPTQSTQAYGSVAHPLQMCLGATLTSGMGTVLNRVGFEQHVTGADLIVTGGGPLHMDTVTNHAGLVNLIERANARGVPVVALFDEWTVDNTVLHINGLDALIPVVDGVMPPEIARLDMEKLVARAALRLGYLLKLKLKRPLL